MLYHLIRNQVKNYFNDLNPQVVADNKKFWLTGKSLFSNKNKIMNTTVVYVK